MPSDRKPSLILPVVVAAVAAHVGVTGCIMYVLVEVLRLGEEETEFYWPIWTVAYLPVVICASITWLRAPGIRLLLQLAAITYFAMLASFYFDAQWWALLVEWFVLALIFFGMAEARRVPRVPRT